MENVISEWLRCPVCGNKTRLKIRGDTELKYFPLFCPKCRQETLLRFYVYLPCCAPIRNPGGIVAVLCGLSETLLYACTFGAMASAVSRIVGGYGLERQPC